MTAFNRKLVIAALAASAGALAAAPASAETVLQATTVNTPITLDGDIADWSGVSSITVPLSDQGEGPGGVSSVELKAAINGDTVYLLAMWADSKENTLHKPYKWDEGLQKYSASSEGEDRFIVSLAKSGDFSPNKMAGSNFEADVWYWKSSRSNPLGLAHDKWWKVSTAPFEKAKKYATESGDIYLLRKSDGGDRLYKSVKYDIKAEDVMARYLLSENPTGSITDVKARGVWRDGKWYLELSRKLDTGNEDDAAIPATGDIEFAVAAASGTNGGAHSVSGKLTLRTGQPGG